VAKTAGKKAPPSPPSKSRPAHVVSGLASVIVDLDATGPSTTPPPIPAAAPLTPPHGIRRVASREACDIFVTRHDTTDGPPWVRHKRFDPQRVPAQRLVERVRAAAPIQHPALARTLGINATPEGTPFVLSEWIPGRSLGQVIRRFRERGGAVPPPVAVHIAAQVAGAMAATHGRRDASDRPTPVYHGSLTPTNVVIGYDGRVVVTDLATAVDTLICGAPRDRREDCLALAALFRDLLGNEAPQELLDLIDGLSSMSELAEGLERWLRELEPPFTADDLSQAVLRLFAPSEGPLASGWHVVIGGDPYGPLPFEELLDTMYRLYLGDPARVWHQGLERWAVVLTIPRVMDLVDELGGAG
jgi:serine/threonine protein kinase